MTETWKTFQNSVIHTSRNHNDETAEVSQLWISKVIITIRRNYSEHYFFQSWARILIWIIIDFIQNYRHIIYKRDYSKYFPFKHIGVHTLCRFSDTGIESLWRHKGVAMHVTYKTMRRFFKMHDSPPTASELRLQISAS